MSKEDHILEAIKNCISNNGTFYWAGCGGCASMADHAAAELIGRLSKAHQTRTPIRSQSLCSNTAILTALANDHGFHHVFSRQLELAGKNDVVFILSTSGNSPSLMEAAIKAHKVKATPVGIVPYGSAIYHLCEPNVIPLINYGTVLSPMDAQEQQLKIIHRICETIHNSFIEHTNKKRTKVLTNGVFNILHAGHIHYLKEASKLGDELHIAIDTTSRASKIKPNKPILPLPTRRTVLEELPFTYRTWSFATDSELEEIIRYIKPDFIVKGPDYKDKDFIGKNMVENAVTIDRKYDYSSSQILEYLKCNSQIKQLN